MNALNKIIPSCLVTLLFIALPAMADNSITINIQSIQVDPSIKYISFKNNYAYAPCELTKDKATCSTNTGTLDGLPISALLQFLPAFQNLHVATSSLANKLVGSPYIELGTYDNGQSNFGLNGCKLSLSHSANYTIQINQNGCVVQAH